MLSQPSPFSTTHTKPNKKALTMPLASWATDLISGRTPTLFTHLHSPSLAGTAHSRSFASTAHPNSVFPHEHHGGSTPTPTDPFTRRASPPPSSKAETTQHQGPQMSLGIDGYDLDPSTEGRDKRPIKEGPSIFETMRSLLDTAARGSQDDTVQMIRLDMAEFNR
jgi:hypothetical protein